VDSEGVVLVGVDGSAQSLAAVSWAADEAAARGAALLVVSVVDTAYLGLWTASRCVRTELRALAEPMVRRAMDQAAARQPGLPVRGRVLLGPVARTFLLLSRHVALVVVGRSGRGTLSSAWLGSLTRRLLAYGDGTTVVVPPGGAASAEVFADNVAAVILGVAGKPTHPAALHFAFASAARHHAPLRAVHAVSEAVTGMADDLMLARCFGPWPARYPSVLCSAVTRTGGVGSVLLDACRPGDLLVVGPHRRGCLEPPRLGSVLTELLSDAPCAVAVVHPSTGSESDLQPGDSRDHRGRRDARQQVARFDWIGTE
jgi:nucleotide-binding universal stress UspA family protein